MSQFVGHATARQMLERALPPVTLLIGPESVGKWTLCNHLAAHHGVAAIDRLSYPDGLSADTARHIVTWIRRAPFGEMKLVCARLHGSSEAALNIMLKTLEEPPPTARFLLTYSLSTNHTTRLPPTVESRAHRFVLGLLPEPQLRQILTGHGMSEAAAGRAALLGRGQVRPALHATQLVAEAPRTAVLGIVRAIATGDRELFDKSFTTFDDTARELLGMWITETITGRFAVFTTADTFGLHRHQQRLLAMLAALSRFATAGPRLAVRAALEPFLART